MTEKYLSNSPVISYPLSSESLNSSFYSKVVLDMHTQSFISLTQQPSLLLLLSLHNLLQGHQISVLIHNEGAIWGLVSERCEMRWKRVQCAREELRRVCWFSNTHSHACMHAHAQGVTNVETRLLPKRAVQKNVIHMRKQGGEGLCNTAKRHRSHLIIHMTVGVADDLLKEWKWIWLLSEKSPGASAPTF